MSDHFVILSIKGLKIFLNKFPWSLLLFLTISTISTVNLSKLAYIYIYIYSFIIYIFNSQTLIFTMHETQSNYIKTQP